MIRRGAVGIIFRADSGRSNYEFLIMRRKFLWRGWEFPKGGIKNGLKKETDEEAVLREIKEETNLDNVKIIHKLPEKMEYAHPKRFKLVGLTGSSHTVFLVEYHGGDIKLSFEHSGFRWLTYEEARKTLTYDTQKRILDAAHKYLISKKA